MSVNQVIVDGMVFDLPTIVTSQSGKPVARFRVAHSAGTKKPDGTWDNQSHYFDVTAVGEAGAWAAEHVKERSIVEVTGKLEQRSWVDRASGQKRYAVGILAFQARFADRSVRAPAGPSGGAHAGGGVSAAQNAQAGAGGRPSPQDDDIPF